MTLEEWRPLIQKQEDSGLSIAAWCRQYDIPYCRFFYWRDKVDVERISTKFVRLQDPPERKSIAICFGGFRVEIAEPVDETLLTSCLRAMARAV